MLAPCRMTTCMSSKYSVVVVSNVVMYHNMYHHVLFDNLSRRTYNIYSTLNPSQTDQQFL